MEDLLALAELHALLEHLPGDLELHIGDLLIVYGYAALLDQRGVEKLLECLNKQSISCSVVDGPMRFGVNYGLEDRVPVVCKDFLGLRLSARVSGVKLVYEDNARQVYPILSDFESLRS